MHAKMRRVEEGPMLAKAYPYYLANRPRAANSDLEVRDKHTGEVRWRVDRDEITSWATPIVVVQQGKPQVVVSGTNRIRGRSGTGVPPLARRPFRGREKRYRTRHVPPPR